MDWTRSAVDGVSRSRALARLREIFLERPQDTGIGSTLMTGIMDFQSDGFLNKCFEDVFSCKAAKTLAKRSSALLRFKSFCHSNRRSMPPVAESTVYLYLTTACKDSASKASQLCEALNFLDSTLQVSGVSEATSGPRVKGFCRRCLLDKRPLNINDSRQEEDLPSSDCHYSWHTGRKLG